jgi:hypothetical protein
MDNLVPGKYNPAGSTNGRVKYAYQAFPKCVYGKDLKDVKIIKTEEDRPDGYRDYADVVAGKTAKTTEAEIAKAEAKAAEKEYRDGIKEYLDANDVDYAKNLSTPRLEELKVALDAHLADQEQTDDAE